MREARLSLLEALIDKGFKFKHEYLDNPAYELVKEDNQILLRCVPNKSKPNEVVEINSSDFNLVSFGTNHLYIEYNLSEHSTISVPLECGQKEYMELIPSVEYYSGDESLIILKTLIEEGYTFSISEYMDRSKTWFDDSVIELKDNRLYLKYGSIKPKGDFDERYGVYIDALNALILFEDKVYLGIPYCGDFIFERRFK